jgi:cytosine/uracil/thiamine/allantoin permease
MVDAKRAFCDRRWSAAADFTVLEPGPYLWRNHQIVDATAALLACPFEFEEQLRSGTWATVRYARTLGRPIRFFWPDGTTTAERAP